MTYRITLAFLLVGAVQADAQTADPRALAACQANDASFVQVEKCLPSADVGIKMLDAIAQANTYGASGAELATRCIETNPNGPEQAWACARGAIDAALRLSKMLPDGAKLDDPLFEALIDPAISERLKAEESAYRQEYPNVSFWGMTMYYPLK